MKQIKGIGLFYELIMAEKGNPNQRKTVAKVYDGKTYRNHEFGANVSVLQIERTLKAMYRDKMHYLGPKSVKISKLDGQVLVALILDDGCIISVNEDELREGTITRREAERNRYKLSEKIAERMKKVMQPNQ